jgi:hypothetical protein
MNPEHNVEVRVIQRRREGASRLRRERATSAEGGGALEGAACHRLGHRLRGLHRDEAAHELLLANLL